MKPLRWLSTHVAAWLLVSLAVVVQASPPADNHLVISASFHLDGLASRRLTRATGTCRHPLSQIPDGLFNQVDGELDELIRSRLVGRCLPQDFSGEPVASQLRPSAVAVEIGFASGSEYLGHLKADSSC